MDVMFITIILSQKSKERASAVSENPKLTEDQKKKWLSVITLDFMSSEESDSERRECSAPPHMEEQVCQQNVWDHRAFVEKKSPQARRQMKKHITGSNSLRPEPLECPEWAKIAQEWCVYYILCELFQPKFKTKLVPLVIYYTSDVSRLKVFKLIMFMIWFISSIIIIVIWYYYAIECVQSLIHFLYCDVIIY